MANNKATAATNQPSDNKPARVLMVCLGNICRSPAAEAVLRRLACERGLEHCIEVDSAGTYGGHSGQLPDHRMRKHAKPRGYELTHRARKVTVHDFDRFDVIVGMDAANVADLRDLAPSIEGARKVVAMGKYIGRYPRYDYVPDPYYEGSEGFELVLDLLEDSCGNLLDEIVEQFGFEQRN